METVVTHVEVGVALGELAVQERRRDRNKGSWLRCDGVKSRMLGCWGAQCVDLPLSERQGKFPERRKLGWEERGGGGEGGRFWAREEPLRSCEELGILYPPTRPFLYLGRQGTSITSMESSKLHILLVIKKDNLSLPTAIRVDLITIKTQDIQPDLCRGCLEIIFKIHMRNINLRIIPFRK